ncbi:MAG TPA: hypothetical protein VM261_09755 [Kofleriaceae bacterium]|nr:hypothetical protein [Kofleriaceae bacterium]
MPPVAKHHFAGSHVALVIDGDRASTAYLKSAEGGMFKSAPTEEPNAAYHIRGKHSSVREMDALSFEFGMSGAKWALGLVSKIVKDPTVAHIPFDGEVHHADSNFKSQYCYEFIGARITEFTLPKLDAKSKEHATLKLKCQPESIEFGITEGAKLPPGSVAKQKQWLCSAFRFTINNGIGEVQASSIESLSVKIGAKAFQVGHFRNPQYTSTGKLEMPKLSFVVPMQFSKELVGWFKNAIGREHGLEDADGGYEKDATIEFMDPTRKNCLYMIHLGGVGPETLSVVKGTNDAATMMKFDCYVTSIELEETGKGVI